MLKEFKEFAMKAMLDLAVAVIIGGAFGQIVTSFVNDVYAANRSVARKYRF